MASHRSEIRTRLRFEPAQTLLAIGAYPAVEGAARVLTLAAIRMLVHPARQLTHDPPAFSRTKSCAGGFTNDAIAKQRNGFSGLVAQGGDLRNGMPPSNLLRIR